MCHAVPSFLHFKHLFRLASTLAYARRMKRCVSYSRSLGMPIKGLQFIDWKAPAGG